MEIEMMDGLEAVPGILGCVWAEGEGAGSADGVDVDEQLETPAEGEETVDPNAGEHQEDDSKQDGRKNPDAIRKHLAAIKANPETAELGKELTNRLGKARGYEKVFPTVKEARAVKQLLETVGGRDAVTAAIESHASMQRTDALLAAGDASVLEDIFKQAPEGMAKLAGPILSKLQESNPKAYNAAIAPHVAQKLFGDGLPGGVNALIDAFNKDDKEGMKDIIGRIRNYIAHLGDGAKPAAKDPDREKFELEKSAFQKEQEDAVIKQTLNASVSYAADKIDEGLKADVKRLGLGPKAVEKLRQEVFNEIVRRRQADKVFTTTLASKFDGRKPKPEATAHLNAFTDKNLTAAIDEVVTTIYGERKAAAVAGKKVDVTAAKKPGTPGAGAKAVTPAAGAIKVAQAPDAKDIDFSDKRTDTFNGRAVRKSDKKLVQWR